MNFLNRSTALVLVLSVLVSCGNKEESKDKASGETPQAEAEYVEAAQFTTLQGDPVELSDFKGKVVLIDFWETWCKPCLAIFPTMQKLLEEYPDDFAVLAVTPGFADTREDAIEFKSNHEYDFNYVMDSGNLSENLKVQSIPFKVFVDAEGSYIKSSLGSYGSERDYKELKSIIEKHKKQTTGKE